MYGQNTPTREHHIDATRDNEQVPYLKKLTPLPPCASVRCHYSVDMPKSTNQTLACTEDADCTGPNEVCCPAYLVCDVPDITGACGEKCAPQCGARIEPPC